MIVAIALYLCPGCAGYEPLTELGYNGQLSGVCSGCLLPKREVHRFVAMVDSREFGPCVCSGGHDRREAAA